MAKNEQLKALLRAHYDGNEEQFKTIALQITAYEAKLGHKVAANELKELIQYLSNSSKSKVIRLKTIRTDLVEEKICDASIDDLILIDTLHFKLSRIIEEYKQKELLRRNGLLNRSRILITGEPGTGKTLTASVLANELKLSLFTVQLDRLVTKYMGETSVKLRQVFDMIKQVEGVYLFDEFDAIGADRSFDNDVGEMRRILNSFLQFIEEDKNNSIIIAATNNPHILDSALFRRFDDVLEYARPDRTTIRKLLVVKLNGIAGDKFVSDKLVNVALGLCQHDIVQACENVAKFVIISGGNITEKLVVDCLEERKVMYNHREA